MTDNWLHSEPASSAPPSNQKDPKNRHSLVGMKKHAGVKTWHVTEADVAKAADYKKKGRSK